MNRVTHFEIAASDPEKSAKFYGAAFGWKTEKWGGPQEYWLVETGDASTPGINGGIIHASTSLSATVNTIAVEDLDQAIARVTSAGGTIVVPKMAIPGVGWLAYAKDPDGNPFGMMEPDADAK